MVDSPIILAQDHPIRSQFINQIFIVLYLRANMEICTSIVGWVRRDWLVCLELTMKFMCAVTQHLCYRTILVFEVLSGYACRLTQPTFFVFVLGV